MLLIFYRFLCFTILEKYQDRLNHLLSLLRKPSLDNSDYFNPDRRLNNQSSHYSRGRRGACAQIDNEKNDVLKIG